MPTCVEWRNPNSCNTCGCNACTCDTDSPPPRGIPVKLDIDGDTAATYFGATICPVPKNVSLDSIVARVRGRGRSTWEVEYPAFDRDDAGRIGFRWDALLFGVGMNRLEVQFRQALGTNPETYRVCGWVELVVTPACIMCVNDATTIKRRAAPAVGEAIEGLDMYDDLIGFSGELCGLLEANDTELDLCQDAIDVLCAAVLCRPVQLAISDGVNTEYVEFSGCVNGTIPIARGKNGTMARRFPVGATLSFVWTTQNMTNAQEGCP